MDQIVTIPIGQQHLDVFRDVGPHLVEHAVQIDIDDDNAESLAVARLDRRRDPDGRFVEAVVRAKLAVQVDFRRIDRTGRQPHRLEHIVEMPFLLQAAAADRAEPGFVAVNPHQFAAGIFLAPISRIWKYSGCAVNRLDTIPASCFFRLRGARRIRIAVGDLLHLW
ncbi:hypothetical protein ACFS07_24015 [Undibacterium arcticum]